MNQEIENYIKQAKASGQTNEQIKNLYYRVGGDKKMLIGYRLVI